MAHMKQTLFYADNHLNNQNMMMNDKPFKRESEKHNYVLITMKMNMTYTHTHRQMSEAKDHQRVGSHMVGYIAVVYYRRVYSC